jgi:hypothetical protein
MYWRVVFQNHFPESSEVHNLWIFIIQSHSLHFTFRFTLPGRGSKGREGIVFRATRDKLFDIEACAKLLQPIREVAQIIACLDFIIVPFFVKVNNWASIAIQHKFPQCPQIPVEFEPSLCSHVAATATLTFPPVATFFSEYLQEIYATSSFGNMRFVTSVPGLVISS